MTIYEVIRDQRRKLIARDRDALLNVTRGFAIARREISVALLTVLNQMSEATQRGEKITESWLRRANRLHALKSQAAGAISRFSNGLELSVLNGQRAEVEQAVRDAAATYHAARSVNPRLPIEFDRLHDDAAQTMIGQLGDGSPLSRLIGQFPKQAAALTEEGLIQGIAIGRNPSETALRLQSAMSSGGMLPIGGPDEVLSAMRKIKTRSLAISRTETLRAYRSSSLATYEANPDVVTGWIWLATLDTRTCASCWAMHGTKHNATEVFGSHVNCRCSPAPDIEGVDLGIRTGEERFALLSTETQLEILGAKKFELYRDKKIALADAVAYQEDKDWGPQRIVASADRALRNAQKSRSVFAMGSDESAGSVAWTQLNVPKGITAKEFKRYVRKLPNETLGVFVPDGSGLVLPPRQGSADKVQPYRFAELPKSGLYAIHSHTLVRPPSKFDLFHMQHMELSRLDVVLPNGWEIELTAEELSGNVDWEEAFSIARNIARQELDALAVQLAMRDSPLEPDRATEVYYLKLMAILPNILRDYGVIMNVQK